MGVRGENQTVRDKRTLETQTATVVHRPGDQWGLALVHLNGGSREAPDLLCCYFFSSKNHSWGKKHDLVPPLGSEFSISLFKRFFFLNAKFARCSEHFPCTDDHTQTAASGLCLQGLATLASRLVAREAEHDGGACGRTREDCRGQAGEIWFQFCC